jgi:hypothetical protein
MGIIILIMACCSDYLLRKLRYCTVNFKIRVHSNVVGFGGVG